MDQNKKFKISALKGRFQGGKKDRAGARGGSSANEDNNKILPEGVLKPKFTRVKDDGEEPLKIF